MLNAPPPRASQKALQRWQELGPLNLAKLIEDAHNTYDGTLAYKEV